MKRLTLFGIILFISFNSGAQAPKQKSAAEIQQALQKLNFLGTVLYVAAHPDDENNNLITYFSNERLARTAYLSMTRGDGGQNLIGTEIREGLGVIRTQELLSARNADGGIQFFTRANDFGYSKNPEETQEIWERDEVLSDVVWVFRNFRPDVVITRFPIDGRGGHGHHTTSAILAHEAFDITNDKNSFKDQLTQTEVWQAKRLYLNTGRWWSPNIDENAEGITKIDVGSYNRLLGQSYSEISAEAKSMHKSQGFGVSGRRGEMMEYLEHRKGEQDSGDVFDGINTSWTRVKGGKGIQTLVEKAIAEFDPNNPQKITKQLLAIRERISKVQDDYWKDIKMAEVDQLIIDCLGLFLEVTSSVEAASSGDNIELSYELVNRSEVPVTLKSLYVNGELDTAVNLNLNFNINNLLKSNYSISTSAQISQPYWLRTEGSLGMYEVPDQSLRGTPENQPALMTRWVIEIDGVELQVDRGVVHKFRDRVEGEVTEPFIVAPPVMINVSENQIVFSDSEPRSIEVTVKAGRNNLSGTINYTAPEGWQVRPERQNVDLKYVGQEQKMLFYVKPPEGESVGEMVFYMEIDGKKHNRGIQVIDYDHFPKQTLFPKSQLKLVKVNLKKKGNVIAYVMGAGDEVPTALRNVGYEVIELADEELNLENFKKADAVVVGIRAYNTRERLVYAKEDLMEYVNQGGTVVVQYTTTGGLLTSDIGPYPFELSRQRVTREDSKVEIVNSDNPIINGVNKITLKDFDGWVQERGLYFPNTWSDKYQTVLAFKDPGESFLEGSVLSAHYGKGIYIYTSLSFFRELPAGVPGAIKLFVNMVSAGEAKPDIKETKIESKR